MTTIYALDGRYFVAEDNHRTPKRHPHGRKRRHHKLKRELKHHAKEAARESVSGLMAGLLIFTIVSVGLGAKQVQ